MKSKLNLFGAFALALLPLALCAQAAADPATPVADTTPFWIKLIAAVTAVVLAARAIVKLTPTPADDSVVEKVVDFLKHVGLHIGCLATLAILILATGCQNPPPTTVGLNTDQDHNITGSVTSQVTSNLNVGVQGSGNPSNGTWTAGVVITFKDAAQINQAARWALEAAEAKPKADVKGGPVYEIANADWQNAEIRNAIIESIKCGATITGL